MKFPATKRLAEDLKTDVYELCQPAGRMVGSEGHRVAEAFVKRRLQEVGCLPYRGEEFAISYRGEGFLPDESRTEIEFTNFAGVIPGKNRELPPVLVGAHYDSVIDAPCADDNGAAVAICLAIASAANVNAKLETREDVDLFVQALMSLGI